MAHNPTTFPEVSSQGTIIDSGREAFLAVSAVYTESSPLVRDLEVERRNCIFADEKNVPNAEITVFKFYSQVVILRLISETLHLSRKFCNSRKIVFSSAEQRFC